MWRSKLEPLYFAGGNVHGAVAVENNMAVPQNLSSKLPTDSAIPLLELKAETQRDTCTPMFTTALLTVTKRRRQPRSPEADKCINEMRSALTMEC